MSSVAPKGEGGNVRNLAYLALQKTANFQVGSRICGMRHVIVSRGVSSVRVFYWALGGASARHGF